MACTEAAGLNSESATVDAIYAKIVTRNVQDLLGTTLTYWATNEESFTTQSLLFYNTGRCEAWAHFWIDLLSVHGTANVQLVGVERILGDGYSPLPEGTGILINNAVTAFNEVSTVDIPADFTVINNSMLLVNNWLITQNNFYSGVSEDPENYPPLLNSSGNASLEGIAGQGYPNPRSIFPNHALVRIRFIETIGGNEIITYKYYDPSYGTGSFTNTNDSDAFKSWEANAIAGFGAFIEYGTPLAKKLWIEKVNSSDEYTDLLYELSSY